MVFQQGTGNPERKVSSYKYSPDRHSLPGAHGLRPWIETGLKGASSRNRFVVPKTTFSLTRLIRDSHLFGPSSVGAGYALVFAKVVGEILGVHETKHGRA